MLIFCARRCVTVLRGGPSISGDALGYLHACISSSKAKSVCPACVTWGQSLILVALSDVLSSLAPESLLKGMLREGT